MSEHVALLASPDAFAPQTIRLEVAAPGVTRVMGCRHKSRTTEPLAYRFDAGSFTADEARAWMDTRTIAFATFEPSDDGYEVDVPLLPASGHLVGKGGVKFDVTPELVDQALATNTRLINEGTLSPAGKLLHEEDQSFAAREFGDGALGRVKSVYKDSAGRLMARMRGVSLKFADAVRRGIWGPVSAEFKRTWTDPKTGEEHPMALMAVAWLGSQMPATAIHEMYQLSQTADEDLLVWLAAGEGAQPGSDGAPMTPEELKTLVMGWIAEALASGKDDTPPTEEKEPAEEEPKKGDEDMDEKEKAQLEAKLAALEAQAKASREALVDLRLSAAVQAGKVTPAEVTAQKKLMADMSDEMVKLSLDTIDAREAKVVTGLVGGGHAALEAKNSAETLIALTDAAQKGDMTVSEAFMKATNENPAAALAWLKDQGLTSLAGKE